jgi:hypothetical protein
MDYIEENGTAYLSRVRSSMKFGGSKVFSDKAREDSLDFQPIFLRAQSVKAIFVEDFQSEEDENIFLRNVKWISAFNKGNQIVPYHEVTERDRHLKEVSTRKILFESLPINLRIEVSTTKHRIVYDKTDFELSTSKQRADDEKLELNIMPQTTK